MGGKLSAGVIVGIVFGCIIFLTCVAGCVFLKTVLDHRRRVRRAVSAAAAGTNSGTTRVPNAVQRFRSRYPEAIPCDNYDELFPEEEPAEGNVVFQSRADIDRIRDVLVRVEDAGEDQSSEDFSTTEVVSINNSFAPGWGHPHAHHHPPTVHAGQILRETLKPYPSLMPAKMGSFDNEHNVSMSFVSMYPTPASSMPAFAGLRSRGGLQSSSFGASPTGSYSASFGAPPVAKADHAGAAAGACVSHFQDRNRGGMRLLVPGVERGHFGNAHEKTTGERSRVENSTSKTPMMTPLSTDCGNSQCEGREDFKTTPQSYNLTKLFALRDAVATEPTAAESVLIPAVASYQTRWDANAASFSSHLSPSYTGQDVLPERHRHSEKLRPAAPPLDLGSHPITSSSVPTAATLPVKMGGALSAAAAHCSLLATTRHDHANTHHAVAVPPKKRKLRIHRQHRVRKVDRGGYVVLEETGSSDGDDGGDNAIDAGPSRESGTAVENQQQELRDGVSGSAGNSSSPSPPPPPHPSNSNAAAKVKESKKKRYYFEKLSSLDVYGRGQYLPGVASGYPPAECGDSSSDAEPVVGLDGQVLTATVPHHTTSAYMPNTD